MDWLRLLRFPANGHRLTTGRAVFRMLAAVVLGQTACSPSRGDKDIREIELGCLRVIMSEDLLDYARLEVATRNHVNVAVDDSQQYLELHLFETNARRSGGVRSEISVDYPFKEGDTVRYEWRFRLAGDFPSDSPANRWWVFGQWHDQPDMNKQENWDNFPSRSPPILLGFGEKHGRLGIVMCYGPFQEKTSDPLWLERGRWYRIAVIIHWSQNDDGQAVLFLDDMDRPAATFTGPNMHNSFQHYLKVGMYRHSGISTSNTLHIDDVAVRHEK